VTARSGAEVSAGLPPPDPGNANPVLSLAGGEHGVISNGDAHGHEHLLITYSTRQLQVLRITKRFGLYHGHARAVAALAFGEIGGGL
jgi:hypothetical protein